MSYMKRSSRLSSALHVLIHFAQHPDQRFTSESIAVWWRTNPVVVRRTLGGLRNLGLVSSVTGHGGGWTLARPADSISLAEIYTALDERLMVVEPESPGCLVESAVTSLLVTTWQRIEDQLMQDLAAISLADLAAGIGSNLISHAVSD